jgi:hypothetical protein
VPESATFRAGIGEPDVTGGLTLLRRTDRPTRSRTRRSPTVPDRAAEEREKDPTPRTPSGRVLGTVGPALFGLGVLAVVVGLGGILIADAVYAWVLVLAASLAAGLLGTALGLAADSAAPTGAWRSPGGAVTLVLRRVAVVIGAVVAAVGIPLFALKVAGFIGGYHTEAYGAKLVEVAISGSCGTVRNNPLV